ncbi:MAG: hypothetical protein IJW89_06020 [Clostridia bacterium]|nr:hypothetical protein [Clostridia bacterium]
MKNTPKWLQNFLMVLGALFWIAVAIKGCAWLTSDTPEPPRTGDRVFIMKEKGLTGWQDIGWLRTYDREQNEGNTKAARKTMRDARKQEKAKRLPYATSGRVVKVAKKPHDTQDGEVYCVQVDFEEHGALWVRSNDMIVTEKAATSENDPAELCEVLKRGDIVALRYTTHLHATEGNAMLDVTVQRMGTDEDLRIWVASLLEMEKAGTALHVEAGTQLEVLRVHKHDTKMDFVRYTVEVAGSRGTWWITGAMLKKPEK